MKNSKTTLVTVLLFLIGFGWLAIMWLDWSRLFQFSAGGQTEELLLSRSLKLCLSFTVSLLVWTCGSARLSVRDGMILSVVFAFFFIADIFFFLNNYIAGISAFTLAQICFIIRNSPGLSGLFAPGSAGKNILRLIMITSVVIVVNGAIVFFVFLPHAANPMFPIIVGYSFFLCCSLCAGLATSLTRHFPSVNTRLIILGVTLLYLGDLTVGLNIILPRSRGYIISTSLTWFFYLPALVMFALSGYRTVKQSSQTI